MPLDGATFELVTKGHCLALPLWHADRPHLIANTLLAARQAAPHLASLAEHLLPRLPRRPKASQTIRAITRDRTSAPLLLDAAITCPWIALDSEAIANVIVVDIDHADGPDRVAHLAAAYGLPRPVLVIDPWSGRSHLIAMLRTPVRLGPDDLAAPQKLWQHAGQLLAAAVGGTLLPRGSLVKSPWGQTRYLIGARMRRTPRPAMPVLWQAYQDAATGLMWHTEAGDLRAYELREIVAALADDYVVPGGVGKTFCKRRPEPSARGRNCSLFDQVRWWAYDQAETDTGAITAEAARVNATLATPLPDNEVAATARSIARFMTGRFSPRIGANSRRGRDRQAGAHLTPQGRRALAGQRSGAARAASTDTKIRRALERLRAAGQRITQAAIAAGAGISLRTVKGRWAGLVMVQDGALSGSAPPRGASGPKGHQSEGYKLPSFCPSPLPDLWAKRITHTLPAWLIRTFRPGATLSGVPDGGLC